MKLHADKEQAQELADAGMPQGWTQIWWDNTGWRYREDRQYLPVIEGLDAPSIGEYLQGLLRAVERRNGGAMRPKAIYYKVLKEWLLDIFVDGKDPIDALHASWIELKPWEGWE